VGLGGLTYKQIAKAVDDEVVNRDLVPAFVKLLKDSEAEVRTAIAGQIPGSSINMNSCTRYADFFQVSVVFWIEQCSSTRS